MCVGLAIGHAALESRSRVALRADPSGYAALVSAVEAACPHGECVYRVGTGVASEKPPHAVRAGMSRLRLYEVVRDVHTAEVGVTGRLWSDPLVYRAPDPTPEQRRTRSLREAFESRSTAPDRPPRYVSLGGGWYAVEP